MSERSREQRGEDGRASRARTQRAEGGMARTGSGRTRSRTLAVALGSGLLVVAGACSEESSAPGTTSTPTGTTTTTTSTATISTSTTTTTTTTSAEGGGGAGGEAGAGGGEGGAGGSGGATGGEGGTGGAAVDEPPVAVIEYNTAEPTGVDDYPYSESTPAVPAPRAGAKVFVSGRDSYDPENEAIEVHWVVTAPDASAVALDEPASALENSFTPPGQGSYEIALEVTESGAGGQVTSDALTLVVGSAHRSCDALTESCSDNGTAVSCCREKLVTGGSFPMGRCGATYDAVSCTDGYSGSSDELPEHTATVADFYLDTFEVTVGRFRAFVAAYDGTPPAEGAGAHPIIAGSGWQSGWNGSLPSSQAALISNLKCYSTYQTWSDAPAGNERYPINCVSWYEAFAFCAWDGGRLATEAEWEYAAAGGSENRLYPWGAQAPDNTLAVFDCGWGGASWTCDPNDRAPVGSTPLGAGRYGQHDLAGSMWEWALDGYDGGWYSGGGSTCSNCANLTSSSSRLLRGGCFYPVAGLRAADRRDGTPADRNGSVGFRCARSP